MIDSLIELVKTLLPAGIVFITAYYLVKKFLDHEGEKKTMDLKLANQTVITPIRLQAYERMVLFLERINPNSMVMRLAKTGSASMFQQEFLKTIRSEFEHNLSQQIYMSSNTWRLVVQAKEETIKLLNVAFTRVNENATALDLAQAIVAVSSQLKELPTKVAIDAIKKEIAKDF